MQDKENKGIGAYRDRPGYFWGGVVGGAILGALVNKMQGKDVARGAMWGGITGGLGSAFVGSGAETAAGTGWLDKMAPGITKSMFSMGAGNPALFGTLVGGTGAWMAGDPKRTESDYEEWLAEEEAKRRKKQIEAYRYWHTPPWATGGMVNARPGFQYGGGAWSGVASDEEIPGSSQDNILSITGQGGIESLGGLEGILESVDMASGPGQGDLSGWHEMFLDLQGKGQIPTGWDFNDFMENLGELDISPGDFAQAGPQTQGRFPFVGGEMAAEGGYKTRPQYRHAGEVRDEEEMTRSQIAEAMLTKSQRGQMWQDEDERKKRMMELVMMNARLKQPTGRLLEDTITRSQQEAEMMGLGAGSEEMVNRRYDFLENRAIDAGPVDMPYDPEEEDETYWEKIKEAAKRGWGRGEKDADKIKDWLDSKGFKAKGGIADLDMTGGGASYGPGTGTSDDIPAMLSDGEFVVTANAVKNLGGGDRMAGAKKMYQMMNKLDPSSQTPAEMKTVGMT